MGFAISWVAVQGVEPKGVLDYLALERTGNTEEIPESPVTCTRLPGGWFLVFVNEFNSSLVADHVLRAQAVTSFRHDEDTADTAEPFDVLISARKATPPAKSRWKLW
jgi:hypothetical protein